MVLDHAELRLARQLLTSKIMTSCTAHISPNSVQGSLRDAPLSRLLRSCKKGLVTGRIEIEAGGGSGWLELRAGVVDEAGFGELSGAAALEKLRGLGDGSYEISQRLPELDGSLGSAASFRGDLDKITLVELMRHCEDNALTCKIVIVHEFDRGEIEYRGGEISRVAFNGAEDEDKIVDMVRLRDARFLVSAPPLDVHLDGWPVVRADPTAPFRIDDLTLRSAAEESAVAGAELRAEAAPLPPPNPSRLIARGTEEQPAIAQESGEYEEPEVGSALEVVEPLEDPEANQERRPGSRWSLRRWLAAGLRWIAARLASE